MHALKVKILTATTLVAILILQGCGWHLRGSQPLPEQLQSLHLQTVSENSSFARSLRRSLKSMDVILTDSASNAAYRLNVSDISHNRRTISTTGSECPASRVAVACPRQIPPLALADDTRPPSRPVRQAAHRDRHRSRGSSTKRFPDRDGAQLQGKR